MESVSALTLRAKRPVAAALPASAAMEASFDSVAAAAEAAVHDAPLPPRRRARDAAEAPGFPGGPHVAHLLAQEVLPAATALPVAALASYQSAIARNGAVAGRLVSLQA